MTVRPSFSPSVHPSGAELPTCRGIIITHTPHVHSCGYRSVLWPSINNRICCSSAKATNAGWSQRFSLFSLPPPPPLVITLASAWTTIGPREWRPLVHYSMAGSCFFYCSGWMAARGTDKVAFEFRFMIRRNEETPRASRIDWGKGASQARYEPTDHHHQESLYNIFIMTPRSLGLADENSNAIKR